MSIKFTRRAAARVMHRGESKIRIKKDAVQDAQKALTTDDVRDLVKSGKVYAIKIKHNMSTRGKIAKIKKAQGRGRGPGSRRGTWKARMGVDYKKRIRAQRRVLKALKEDKTLDNIAFKKFYLLVKGGTFANKWTLINHIKSTGIAVSDERAAQLRHI